MKDASGVDKKKTGKINPEVDQSRRIATVTDRDRKTIDTDTIKLKECLFRSLRNPISERMVEQVGPPMNRKPSGPPNNNRMRNRPNATRRPIVQTCDGKCETNEMNTIEEQSEVNHLKTTNSDVNLATKQMKKFASRKPTRTGENRVINDSTKTHRANVRLPWTENCTSSRPVQYHRYPMKNRSRSTACTNELKLNRSAAAFFRCLTAMPPQRSTKDGILPADEEIRITKTHTNGRKPSDKRFNENAPCKRTPFVDGELYLKSSCPIPPISHEKPIQIDSLYQRTETQPLSCSILPVPYCHATTTKHEGWDTARFKRPSGPPNNNRMRNRPNATRRPIVQTCDGKCETNEMNTIEEQSEVNHLKTTNSDVNLATKQMKKFASRKPTRTGENRVINDSTKTHRAN
ncbi:hypothetical protein CLF_101744, partial [Clonorchis sinensis]